MSTASIEWSIEHLETINDRGQKMTKIIESYPGTDHEARTYMVPSFASEGFVRARRAHFQRLMSERGHIKLLLN